MSGGSLRLPSLGLATNQTVRTQYIVDGAPNAPAPTLPHKMTPIVTVTPQSLTVKAVTITAATNRPFNFASDRAGEFTVGCLPKNTPMLTAVTTITRVPAPASSTAVVGKKIADAVSGVGNTIVSALSNAVDGKAGGVNDGEAQQQQQQQPTTTSNAVTGTYFDWREFTNDSKLSEQLQTMRAALHGRALSAHDQLQAAAANTAAARLASLQDYAASVAAADTNNNNGKSGGGAGATTTTSTTISGGKGVPTHGAVGASTSVTKTTTTTTTTTTTSNTIGGGGKGGVGFGSVSRDGPTPVASGASAAAFGFYNLASVSHEGAGRPFAAFPFFTGDALPMVPPSASAAACATAEEKPTMCAFAVWSPAGGVNVSVEE